MNFLLRLFGKTKKEEPKNYKPIEMTDEELNDAYKALESKLESDQSHRLKVTLIDGTVIYSKPVKATGYLYLYYDHNPYNMPKRPMRTDEHITSSYNNCKDLLNYKDFLDGDKRIYSHNIFSKEIVKVENENNG